MEKEAYTVEYLVKTSPAVLFNYLKTPSGLSERFADNVNINKDGIYSFFWDGAEEEAKMISTKRNDHVRFQWLEDEEDGLDTYFEFKLAVDPLTNETALIVTDFAEPDEQEEAMLLWEKQITMLMRLLGIA